MSLDLKDDATIFLTELAEKNDLQLRWVGDSIAVSFADGLFYYKYCMPIQIYLRIPPNDPRTKTVKLSALLLKHGPLEFFLASHLVPRKIKKAVLFNMDLF